MKKTVAENRIRLSEELIKLSRTCGLPEPQIMYIRTICGLTTAYWMAAEQRLKEESENESNTII